MTLFEYLSIAISLVLSFSAIRLLAGLPHLLDPDRRYWVHTVFVLCSLIVTAVGFWNFWNFRAAMWTLPRFLLALTIPGSLYYCACALVPDDASAVDSWHDYYWRFRRRYFAGLIVIVVAISTNLYVLLDVSIFDPSRVPQLTGGVVGLIGFFSDNHRVHAAVALALAAALAASSLTAFLLPGSLASG